MKTSRELIQSINPVKSNLDFISAHGQINGSLLIDLERIMDEYANQEVDRVLYDKSRSVVDTEVLEEMKKALFDAVGSKNWKLEWDLL